MKQNKEPMRIIGVTGGVGAGKSTVLDYLKKEYDAVIFLADEVAKQLLMPGEKCYDEVRSIFPEDVFTQEGAIHRERMAALIFAHPEYREKQNAIVFPAVRHYIEEQIKLHRQAGTPLLVIEAALLIEEHYDEICDEMWYIYTDEKLRKKRLMESRGYSEDKTAAIMASQLSEDEFRRHSDVVICNSHTPEETYKEIDEAMKKGTRRRE